MFLSISGQISKVKQGQASKTQEAGGERQREGRQGASGGKKWCVQSGLEATSHSAACELMLLQLTPNPHYSVANLI